MTSVTDMLSLIGTPLSRLVNVPPRGVWALVLCVLSCLSPGVARAEVSAQLSTAAPKIEAGHPLRVQLTVTSDDDAPESPRLTIPTGFGLRGPSVSTRFSTSIQGWSAQTRRSIDATWEVTPSKTGTFTIGPAQAFVNGKPVTSNAVRVEVVAPGTLPAPPPAPTRRGPRSLFDDDDFTFPGFPGLGGRGGRSMLDDLLQQQVDTLPPAPSDYQVNGARDRTAFLEATVTPEHAVVGQQVTLRIVAYGAAGRFRESDPREPRRTDFFSTPLQSNSTPEQLYSVRVGETDYLAVKVREYALFPLKAGKLEIGPMKMAFYGSNYVSARTGQPIERESKALYVDVSEPPSAGRPLDYQVGDVGRFELRASVSPKQVREGDSFSVVAVLEGKGRLPETLRVPEQTGLEWLKPTTNEQSGIAPDKQIVGKRTFTFIVKATRVGTLDLGKLTLPYFNPEGGNYAVASATLGNVVVEPGAAAAASTTPADDKRASPAASAAPELELNELASARRQLRPFTRDSHWTHAAWVWPTLFGLPLGVALTQLSGDRLMAWLRRRQQRRNSLGNRVSDELKQVDALQSQGDLDGALVALERTVFLAIEHATQLKARGVLRERLAETLTQVGLTSELAAQLVGLLGDLEALRFARNGDLASLVARAKTLIGRLPQPQRVKPLREAT